MFLFNRCTVLLKISKKITTHPDIAHPFGNTPFANYESGIPAYSLLVKVAWGVFQRCVETTLEKRNFRLQLSNCLVSSRWFSNTRYFGE